jgi:Raf kinase inhibitor-like YbhB/YbcL family protein
LDAPFTLTSPAFELGEPIPARSTCDGENHSPALLWTAPPEGTRSLAIAMEDPDAPSGEFVHWLGWGLEPHLRGLPEGVEPPFEGRNDFGGVGYGGPCPPLDDAPHEYVFRLFALATAPDFPPGSRMGELREFLAEELVEAVELTATYARRGGGDRRRS